MYTVCGAFDAGNTNLRSTHLPVICSIHTTICAPESLKTKHLLHCSIHLQSVSKSFDIISTNNDTVSFTVLATRVSHILQKHVKTLKRFCGVKVVFSQNSIGKVCTISDRYEKYEIQDRRTEGSYTHRAVRWIYTNVAYNIHLSRSVLTD